MVRGMAVARLAALQARAGGGEGSAPILAAYDPVGVVRRTGRWMNSGAQGKHRDGPPNKFGGIYAKNSPPNQFGGIYAKDAPVNQSGGVSPDAAASGAGGPASGAATSKMSGISMDGLVPEGSGGEIASSVPAEVRVQTGHSGTWIASSVPAEIRARAQSAYEQAYSRAPLTLLAEPYLWRAETVQSRAHTRAYRAYLGATPAAGDPTASARAGAGQPASCQDFVGILCQFPTGTGVPLNDLCAVCPQNCNSPGCSCLTFYYVVYVKFPRIQEGWRECACDQRTGCKCGVPIWRQRAVPGQRERKMCASTVRTETGQFPVFEAECSDCGVLSRSTSEGDCKCAANCRENPTVPCCVGGARSCRHYCDTGQPNHACNPKGVRNLLVSKGDLCVMPNCP